MFHLNLNSDLSYFDYQTWESCFQYLKKHMIKVFENNMNMN